MGLLQLREHRGTSYVKVHRSAAEPDFGAEASSGEVLQVARKHLGAGPQAGCVLLAEPVDSNCDWMHWSSALSTAQRQPKSRRLLMRLTRQPLGRNGTGNGVNAREVQCLRPLDLRIGPEGRCDGSRFALRHSACLVQHNERLLASRGPALEHGRVPHQAVVPATGHAQGQASIMTARPNCSARQILSAGSCGASSMSPAKRRNSHTAAVAKLSKRTQGTKRDARSSARRWTLGLLPCARDTSSASLPRVVAGPTAVTDMMISPLASVEPAKQHAADDPGGAPASFSTGADSPVTRDSSAAPPPSTTTPSAGKREPTETRQRSPSSNSSRGISWKLPPFSGSRTMAVVGWAAKSSFSAAAVRCRARNSSFLPPRTTSNNTGAIARKCAALPRSSVSTGLSALVKHKTVSPSP
mmetsp:Transcript_53429/g.173833  ORF Transcript_53429/g.173833 Transcript_53429/m.173833 type:complete len:412 (-) Transcript_53429:2553-3788(-)